MYSMAAFGPVLGFLVGAYLLSFHMDSLSKIISIGKILCQEWCVHHFIVIFRCWRQQMDRDVVGRFPLMWGTLDDRSDAILFFS